MIVLYGQNKQPVWEGTLGHLVLGMRGAVPSSSFTHSACVRGRPAAYQIT